MPFNLLHSVANHLWQSTLVAAGAAVMALALKRNEGRVRYWVWFAASLKFLVPFSWLMDFGSLLARPVVSTQFASGLLFTFDTVIEPFARPVSVASVAATNALAEESFPVGPFLAAIWFCGCAVVLLRWVSAQRRFGALKRLCTPLTGGCEYEAVRRLKGVMGIRKPVTVMCTATAIEPGVLGLFRPVLLLPESLSAQVDEAEFDTIVAHELAHVRRCDNLYATIHMVIETIFWFYPLVWWLKTNLIKERERACDEEVLKLGSEPRAYAEAILKICEFCLGKRSPFFVSTVAGANLQKRIEEIMTHPIGDKLNLVRQIGLIAGASAALSIPFFVGFVNASELKTQSQTTERLVFEVASVRPNEPSSDSTQVMKAMTLQYLPSGRFFAKSVSIPALVFEAYGVIPGPSGRISVSPEFQKSMDQRMASETYDIEAIAEKDVIPATASPSLQRERLRLMLQSLLTDRFKVRIRRETKDVPVYAMVVGRNGAKLQKSTMDETRCTATSSDKPQVFRLFTGGDSVSCHSFAGAPRFGLHAEAIDMSDLAAIVERFSDRPVLDHTGLTGLYKIATPAWGMFQSSEPAPDTPAPGDSLRPTLSTLLQDVGLRLESTKATVEMFVVERFERPAQN